MAGFFTTCPASAGSFTLIRSVPTYSLTLRGDAALDHYGLC
jgi:hypothetical protein